MELNLALVAVGTLVLLLGLFSSTDIALPTYGPVPKEKSGKFYRCVPRYFI